RQGGRAEANERFDGLRSTDGYGGAVFGCAEIITCGTGVATACAPYPQKGWVTVAGAPAAWAPSGPARSRWNPPAGAPAPTPACAPWRDRSRSPERIAAPSVRRS